MRGGAELAAAHDKQYDKGSRTHLWAIWRSSGSGSVRHRQPPQHEQQHHTRKHRRAAGSHTMIAMGSGGKKGGSFSQPSLSHFSLFLHFLYLR